MEAATIRTSIHLLYLSIDLGEHPSFGDFAGQVRIIDRLQSFLLQRAALASSDKVRIPSLGDLLSIQHPQSNLEALTRVVEILHGIGDADVVKRQDAVERLIDSEIFENSDDDLMQQVAVFRRAAELLEATDLPRLREWLDLRILNEGTLPPAPIMGSLADVTTFDPGELPPLILGQPYADFSRRETYWHGGEVAREHAAGLRVVRTSMASPWVTVFTDLAANSRPILYAGSVLFGLHGIMNMIMRWRTHIEDVKDRRFARDQAVSLEEQISRFIQNNRTRFYPSDGSAADADAFAEISNDLAKLAPVKAAEMIDENDPRVHQ